jgi:two-component system OmpR family response regulator
VLLVEDSQAIGDLMAHVLRAAGYDVVHVTRVRKALAAIEAERFGVVIADLQLPDGRGEEIIEAARARSQQTAILVASGEVTVINGVDGVLLKPFSNEDLRSGIRRAVELRREAR